MPLFNKFKAKLPANLMDKSASATGCLSKKAGADYDLASTIAQGQVPPQPQVVTSDTIGALPTYDPAAAAKAQQQIVAQNKSRDAFQALPKSQQTTVLNNIANNTGADLAKTMGVLAATGIGAAGLGYGLYRTLGSKRVKPVKELYKQADWDLGLNNALDALRNKTTNMFAATGSAANKSFTSYPEVTMALGLGVPTAAIGTYLGLKGIKNLTKPVQQEDADLAKAKAEFNKALAGTYNTKTASNGFNACMGVMDALIKQANPLDYITGGVDVLGRVVSDVVSDPLKASLSAYLPIAGAAGLVGGYMGYTRDKKLDPDRIKARAAKDAYKLQRIVKPPVIQLAVPHSHESAGDLEGLSNADTEVVSLPIPRKVKQVESRVVSSDLSNQWLAKAACYGNYMAANNWLDDTQLEKLAQLNKVAGGFDGTNEEWLNLLNNKAMADQINPLLEPELAKNGITRDQLISALQGKGGIEGFTETLANIGDKVNLVNPYGWINKLTGLSTASEAINSRQQQAVLAKLNEAVGSQSPLRQQILKETMQSSGGANPALSEAEPSQMLMQTLKGMHPLQVASLLGGGLGMASGNNTLGLLGILLGIFGKDLFKMIPGMENMNMEKVMPMLKGGFKYFTGQGSGYTQTKPEATGDQATVTPATNVQAAKVPPPNDLSTRLPYDNQIGAAAKTNNQLPPGANINQLTALPAGAGKQLPDSKGMMAAKQQLGQPVNPPANALANAAPKQAPVVNNIKPTGNPLNTNVLSS